jgi:hypothetical protein
MGNIPAFESRFDRPLIMDLKNMALDWFRSWHGAPTDPKWLAIARRANVAPGIAVAIAWALMDRASQAADRGSIEGYDAEALAYFYGCEPDQAKAVILAMADKGMLIDGRFTAWERRQPKREDDSAERTRAWRDRQQAQRDAPVTQCDASERNVTLDKIREDTDEKERKKETEVVFSQSSKTEIAIIPEIEKQITVTTKPKRKVEAGEFIPENWEPNPENWDFAVKMLGGATAARDEIAQFKDYWGARAGPLAKKRDWQATFRNRVREQSKGKQKGIQYAGQRPDPRANSISAAARRLADKLDNSAGGGEIDGPVIRLLPMG